jgi:hypothetical protein
MMRRRQLDSLLLDENVIDSLLKDAREFLEVEDWFVNTYGVAVVRPAYDVPIGISVQEFRIAEVTCFMGLLEPEKVSNYFFPCAGRLAHLTPSPSFNYIHYSKRSSCGSHWLAMLNKLFCRQESWG